MKKLMMMFALMLTLTLMSCETSAQVVYDDSYDYYEYYDYTYNTPVVYIRSIPYYRYWIDGGWRFYRVPDNRFIYIHRHDRPIRQPHYYVHDHMTHHSGHVNPHTYRHDMYNNRNHFSGSSSRYGVQTHTNHISRPQNGNYRPNTRQSMPSNRNSVSFGGGHSGGRR